MTSLLGKLTTDSEAGRMEKRDKKTDREKRRNKNRIEGGPRESSTPMTLHSDRLSPTVLDSTLHAS